MTTTTEIDFHRIRSFRGSREHGFEELCTQLAALESRPADAIFYRKGTGADAGVECFLRRKDGTETGWQAKYFFQLRASQIAQLDKSIRTALSKHPRLDRYVVCIPFNLPDPRLKKPRDTDLSRWEAWAEKWKTKAKDKSRALTIELWSASELIARLTRSDAAYAGKREYWFDETVFTPDWFMLRFKEACASLGQRYMPKTNVALPVRRDIRGFCRDPRLYDELEEWRAEIDQHGHRTIGWLRRLNSRTPLLEAVNQLDMRYRALTADIGSMPREPATPIPLEDLTACVRETQRALGQCRHLSWDLKELSTEESEAIKYASYDMRELEEALSDLARALKSHRWQLANARTLLVYGEAGVGKSHMLGDAVESQLEHGRPALLLLGSSFIDNEPWAQIAAQLGLPFVGPNQLLGALDSAAAAAGVRAVIFIDAINERNGIHVWATRLASFLERITPFPHVGVALSCRTTYLPFIVDRDGEFSIARLEHRGFAGTNAAQTYLDKRGIVRMAAPYLVPEFDNPLFLKICCDYVLKQGLTEIPRGLRGITAIFGFYSEAVATAVQQRLGLDPYQRIVQRALEAFALACDQGERGYLEREEAIRVFEAVLPSQGQFEKSLLAQLEHEGVLAIEPVQDEDGQISDDVRFTFERYSDHRIASLLLDRHASTAGVEEAFKPGMALHGYCTGKTSYERAGVIEALAIQVPERFDRELPDLVEVDYPEAWPVSNGFLRSVLWRDQKKFTERTITLLESTPTSSGDNELNRTLIAIATEPDNRFNALFLDERLKTYSMPDRDVRWSTYLAGLVEETEENPVDTLIEWTAENAFGPIDGPRAELIGITLAWFLSTNHRVVRDLATKALASLLVNRIPLATKLVQRFAGVDDLYVVERVFAAAYGAALQCQSESHLQALARAAYEAVFEPDPPVVHVLIRDYARGILECAHRRGCLPTGIEIESARPPYKSPWPIERVSDAEIEAYVYTLRDKSKIRDSIVASAVNDGDFARYIIDTSLQDATALPIAHVGKTREELYVAWRGRLEKDFAHVLPALVTVEVAADAFRAFEFKLGSNAFLYRLPWREKEAPSPATQRVLDEISRLDASLQAAETALEAALGADAWNDYHLYGQDHIHRAIRSENRHFHWPPRFSRTLARRFVCKRAHDLGWTAERFTELERGLGGNRTEHRIERVGKKYQWIAFHELLARVGDNVAFRAYGDGEDELVPDPGPWDHRGRDIDPSLLATESQDDDDGRAWTKTWWMRQAVRMKPVTPMQRLEWLDEPVDIVDGSHLIEVTQPETGRRWLVVDQFLNWNQSAVRDGEDRLERTCFSDINAVIVANAERKRLLAFLSNRIIFSHDLIPVEFPSRAFIGEYPWHPSCKETYTWTTVRNGKIRLAPAGGEYHASRSGHDYSIKRDFRFSVPSALLIQGLGLRLSNGKALTYVDQAGKICFFDPSTAAPGPRAALVDRDVFLAFLAREGLDAVWVISGEKSVHGGPQHGHGWGGERRFTSLYWLTPDGFEHRTFSGRNDPGPEQLKELFDGAPVPAAAWRLAIPNYRPPASKTAKHTPAKSSKLRIKTAPPVRKRPKPPASRLRKPC